MSTFHSLNHSTSSGFYVANPFVDSTQTTRGQWLWIPTSDLTSPRVFPYIGLGGIGVAYGKGRFIQTTWTSNHYRYHVHHPGNLGSTANPGSKNTALPGSPPSENWPVNITYSNNMFMTAPYNPTSIAGDIQVSNDGWNWTTYAGVLPATNGYWTAPIFNTVTNSWLTISEQTYEVWRSDDNGATWAKVSDLPISNFGGIAYGAGRFIVCDSAYAANQVYIGTNNGETWITGATPGSTIGFINSITYNEYDKQFVLGGGWWAGGTIDARLLTSPDGNTWTARETGSHKFVVNNLIGDDSGNYVAFGNTYDGSWGPNTIYLYSTDNAVTWTLGTLPVSCYFDSRRRGRIAWGDRRLTYEYAVNFNLDNPNAYGTVNFDMFGQAVAIDGNIAIVAAAGEDDASGTTSGKVYIYNIATGVSFNTLDNPNAYSTSADDQFGYSVDIDTSSVCAIVGARFEDDAGGAKSGKAYIFSYTTGNLLHTLNNPNPTGTSANDRFGAAVGISGTTCIVGAYEERDASGNRAGKVYIYNSGSGSLERTIDNPDPVSGDSYFGQSIAIDGTTAIVGAPETSITDGSVVTLNTGRVYIINVSTGATLHTIENPGYVLYQSDRFGSAVAISGNYAIVGVRAERSDAGETYSGKAYIFNVTTGALLHTLDNPNAYGTRANDNFGCTVGISEGNQTAIVGAWDEDDADGLLSGKAYMFRIDTGQLTQTLDNPNTYSTSANDRFGSAVAIANGNAIVGAPGEESFSSGKAYIYKFLPTIK
jgi:hypothetical protein|tara:strand:+ start:976 stop:3264 length:2289 start_codon:yes stop_codon:yes gene_type:complete